MKTAPVNRIIPMSVVDGPGNRTAIFLQGCNIACGYCHNPETQKLCCGCGLCVAECPAGALSVTEDGVFWEEERCTGCDHCLGVCTHWASPKVKVMSAEEVFLRVRRNLPFIRGITVSGGECSLYPEFLTELFGLARQEGLTCLMDSNGMVDLSLYPELLRICDGIMLDVKSWNPEVYHKLTGADNRVVLENLDMLAKTGKLLEVRIVCKPGIVDAEDVICGIARRLNSISDGNLNFRLKLIAFRPYGVKGFMQGMEAPSEVYMKGLESLAMDQGFRDIIIT